MKTNLSWTVRLSIASVIEVALLLYGEADLAICGVGLICAILSERFPR